jgi:hypothetical protein
MIIVFLALSPDLHSQLTIGAVVVAVMLLNLIVMILARHILPVLGGVSQALGAVPGVVQAASGFRITNRSLKALGLW